MLLDEKPWATVWESKSGIWNYLSGTEFKQFLTEDLAMKWANEHEVTK